MGTTVVTGDKIGGDAFNFDTSKTAQTALHEELEALVAQHREPTEGERARIEALMGYVGRDQHPEIDCPESYAKTWAQLASGLEYGPDQDRSRALALDLACLEQGYPEFSGK